MRFCENETVKIYEGIGENLAELLRNAADVIEDHEGHANVHTAYDPELGNVVTVYLHG